MRRGKGEGKASMTHFLPLPPPYFRGFLIRLTKHNNNGGVCVVAGRKTIYNTAYTVGGGENERPNKLDFFFYLRSHRRSSMYRANGRADEGQGLPLPLIFLFLSLSPDASAASCSYTACLLLRWVASSDAPLSPPP